MEAVAEFDATAASAVAKAVLESDRGKAIAAMSGKDYDSLVTDLTSALWQAREGYDPERSKYTTWASTVCQRRLIDFARRATGRKQKLVVYMGGVPEVAGGVKQEADFSDFAKILRAVAAASDPTFRPKWGGRRGGAGYTEAQMVAILCLARVLELSPRKIQTYLREHAEVRDALWLPAVPSFQAIWLASWRHPAAKLSALLAEATAKARGER